MIEGMEIPWAWVWFVVSIVMTLIYRGEAIAHNHNLTELGNKYAELLKSITEDKQEQAR